MNLIDQLENYEKEYFEKFSEYEIAKEETFESLIKENEKTKDIDRNSMDINWKIDFFQKTLDIDVVNKYKLEPISEIDNETINTLRIQTITVTAMEEILSEYVSEGYDLTAPTYQKYFEKYTIKKDEHEIFKEELAKKYNVDKIQWKIDYNTKTLYKISK